MVSSDNNSARGRIIYEFGPFRLDAAERLLMRDGYPVPVTVKVFDILLLLVRNHGHLVTKEELMKEIWPDSFVEDNNLTVNISALRKVLGESASGNPYIETVPRRGYRFLSEIREIPDDSAHTPTRQPPLEAVDSKPDRATPVAGDEAGAPGTPELLRTVTAAARIRRWWPGALAATLLLAILVFAVWYFRFGNARPGGLASLERTSMAVLPFKIVGAEGSDALLGLGIADALITRLSGPGSMIIRPTGSILQYNGAAKDVVTAGRELQVNAVLDGTLLKAGERVRITARLLRVEDGRAVWTTTFDEPWTGVFALQDLISARLTQELAPLIAGSTLQQSKTRQTESPAAYQLYLKGLVFWDKRTEEGLRKAIDYFGQAIEADPTYALAYAGLADCYLNLATYGVLPAEEAYSRSKAAALKALERDDSLAEPYATLGMVTLYRDWDWPSAEKAFRQAIERKPDLAIAHQRYALGLMRMGRFEEALAEIRLAEKYDPLSQIISANVGQVLYHARRYDEAIAELRKELQANPGFWMAHRILGEAYLQKKLHAEAIAELNEAIHTGGGPPVQGELGYAYAISGNKDEAVKILGELNALARKRYVSPFAIALVHVGLGDKDLAFEYLQKSFEERSRWLMTMKIDPMLDSLRSDPRFSRLLARIGL